jgi:hypothetical protein
MIPPDLPIEGKTKNLQFGKILLQTLLAELNPIWVSSNITISNL